MAFSRNSHFFLGSNTHGLPPEARINSDILGLPWIPYISNLHLDWVTVDFQVRMGHKLFHFFAASFFRSSPPCLCSFCGSNSKRRRKKITSRSFCHQYFFDWLLDKLFCNTSKTNVDLWLQSTSLLLVFLSKFLYFSA
ncbi:uncharacterized protein LOC125468924 isoform X2 [Pyrus x bretschneideri]|uniref:uncharacterized protein LOC125468924 isoform X2 n=1 Tax=Pyrus x bretschneideri TaxID=225117 RepID=UPI00202DF001|nr:uncharacterized protein LOC125468924 isoform X2 [Pyrus x bretschneideri]